MAGKRPRSGSDDAAGRASAANAKRSKPAGPPSAADQNKGMDAIAKAKAALAARLGPSAASNAKASPMALPPRPATATPPPDPSSATSSSRLASIGARIEALKAKAGPSALAGPADGHTTAAVPAAKASEPAPNEADPNNLKGGLSIAMHPALMGGELGSKPKGKFAQGKPSGAADHAASSQSKAKGKHKDKASEQDDQGGAPRNPYYDATPRAELPAGVLRRSRKLKFVQPGKYIALGAKAREQARLEKIKADLASQTRLRAQEESEQVFVVKEPPEVEWWDEPFLEERSYECLKTPEKVKIGEGSFITNLVQHPVLLKAPQDNLLVPVKAMYLTSKEQAKLRRMRRAEDLKEQQAKIRLGLVPPPEPKVTRKNMMLVLGEQAIADPTAVEMKVDSQIRERQTAHVQANEERKLSKEQRRDKIAEQQRVDAEQGIRVCVFRVDSLAHGKHRYQVDVNAKEHGLTGVVLLHARASLVVVEGGVHSTTAYKKLMLHRIRWTENAAPSKAGAGKGEGEEEAEPEWLRAVDGQGKVKDLSGNKCTMVFEGEVREHQFRRWTSKVCESEGAARDALSRVKLESLWGLA